ncbi:DUF2294 domain-containing protein [Pleurocapsales cyanobacterium LEGE 10410]|nr:DUF2294 domain-containing protein [Pleurocapsales cyanobacterium LEGE 10410]
MDNNLPTRGQLERNLSQTIQKLYRQKLEHSPGKITCQLFGEQLAIVIEDALTAVEKTLIEAGQETDTVKQLNSTIGSIIESELKSVVETTLSVKVADVLFDTTLKTSRTGVIVTLDRTPEVRNPESIPKNNHSKQNNQSIVPQD